MLQNLLVKTICFSVAFIISGNLIAQEQNRPKDAKPIPAVGTWDLVVEWEKGDDGKVGNHILTIDSDLSGEIKEVDEGWAVPLRNLKINNDTVSFSFYYDEK